MVAHAMWKLTTRFQTSLTPNQRSAESTEYVHTSMSLLQNSSVRGRGRRGSRSPSSPAAWLSEGLGVDLGEVEEEASMASVDLQDGRGGICCPSPRERMGFLLVPRPMTRPPEGRRACWRRSI